MTEFTGIAYEPHPVSPERKADLRAQGLRIIDAQFKPHDGGEVSTVVVTVNETQATSAQVAAAVGKAVRRGLSRNT